MTTTSRVRERRLKRSLAAASQRRPPDTFHSTSELGRRLTSDTAPAFHGRHPMNRTRPLRLSALSEWRVTPEVPLVRVDYRDRWRLRRVWPRSPSKPPKPDFCPWLHAHGQLDVSCHAPPSPQAGRAEQCYRRRPPGFPRSGECDLRICYSHESNIVGARNDELTIGQ
jgi:hypothetical protein